MWIVNLALARPRTVAVMCLLILIFGVLSIFRMPTDIFPTIDIPVVTVVWSYGGLAPEEMETRVVNVSERSYTTTVGYGSLILSSNGGVRAFGIAAILGELACIAMALMLAPALLVWWRDRRDRATLI